MKNILKTLAAICFLSNVSIAQLSNLYLADTWSVGFNLGVSSIKNKALLFEDGQRVGPYLGVGMDLAYQTYDPWMVRYKLEAKWVNDLGYKGIELIRGTGTDPRLDFTGFTWHKIGLNVFATDNICVALGGSFADYIVDIPQWTENGTYWAGEIWQEPSGWHWTAGPCVFVDYGIGDFAVSLTSSYDIRYFHPIVTNDYEDLVNAIEGYTAPGFLYTDISINHDSGFYCGFDKIRLVDNGEVGNKMSRTNLRFGWRVEI